jgi:ATP-binding cassette subfamily G (WHITE) protein 2 (PDR)
MEASYEGFDASAQANIHSFARELIEHAGGSSALSKSFESLGGNGLPSERPSVDEPSESMDDSRGVVAFDTSTRAAEPRLDPRSPLFDSKHWVKNLKKMMDADPDHYKPTSLSVAFKNLRAYGRASDTDYQPTVLNAPLKIASDLWASIANRNDPSRNFDILKPMDGLIKSGTVTVVLGRPGAGCTTFLKTIASHTHGFSIAKESVISYDGITPAEIRQNYRGDVTYSAETDVHFPHLTVGQTLDFAARLRAPQNRPDNISRDEYAKHITDVYMATYGLSHTFNTKVGNDLVRGVSGGERKRVSIAEVSICGSYLQCWDNATRGLDAATALEFVRALKTSADVLDITSLIAIYQCSQDTYDLFDNCILLYEGYQIYSGSAKRAKDYFLRMGFDCPSRQTTADFLTSLTNPAERIIRKGFEKKVPKTPKQFYDCWNTSPENEALGKDVDDHMANSKAKDARAEFSAAHRARQSDRTRSESSFTVSYFMQIRELVRRNILRIKGDPSVMIGTIGANIMVGLVISSLFYNLQPNTGSLAERGGAMFFALLFNCISSMLEIIALFEARPIVEKQKQYALYHPSADAFASIITELPSKILICIVFNVIYYFMVNFKREAAPFFFFMFVNFISTLYMSHMFRTVGSIYKTLPEAMTPASIVLLAMILYCGFSPVVPTLPKWSRWINYVNPVTYSFEALMGNEFTGRNFPCTSFVPSGGAYDSVDPIHRVCATVGSVAGQTNVNGDTFLKVSYDYAYSLRWRNIGIICAYIVFFLFTYLLACEWNKGSMQRGEVALFLRQHLGKLRKAKKKRIQNADVENSSSLAQSDGSLTTDEMDITKSGIIAPEDLNQVHAGTDIFHWRDVCYDVQIKSETRRILNNVCGWIKPGTLTALMGASGAGKTTLLDVLASRVTTGVIYGHMFVNGHLRDESFQRSTGYAQQQDLHFQTATVRESLRFSAYLRQPASVSIEEKNAYVETVIRILEMERYADAIVGVAGEGLNVEQRKRLTIGVEMAAKPRLLLFLDEPTSGLDSQTAWSVCQLMRKLADHGQAILCTIHQPSALLLQEFDRLLFLAKGGKTVYFGELGKNAKTLIHYFESRGAPKCPPEANPAEWMLHVIGAAPGSHANQDYHDVWIRSKQFAEVRAELQRMEKDLVKLPRDDDKELHQEFAAPLLHQYVWVTKRVFEQYYRTPSYIWAKILLTTVSALFNGFTFYNSGTSIQGLSNQMLSVFASVVVLNPLVNQILPSFVYQRSLYETRERPSKTFGWLSFVLAQITAEIPWHALIGTLAYFVWYYPVGLYSNTIPTDSTAERGALVWLYQVAFYIYVGTFGQAWVAGIDSADLAGQISSSVFIFSITFCGVLKLPTGFWTWMYHVSPFTYYIQGTLAASLADNKVVCRAVELISFSPPANSTCGSYMGDFIASKGGYLIDAAVSSDCKFCTLSDTNTFLKNVAHTETSVKWPYFGVMIAYITLNTLICIFLFWLCRVPKKKQSIRSVPDQNTASKSAETSMEIIMGLSEFSD